MNNVLQVAANAVVDEIPEVYGGLVKPQVLAWMLGSWGMEKTLEHLQRLHRNKVKREDYMGSRAIQTGGRPSFHGLGNVPSASSGAGNFETTD